MRASTPWKEWARRVLALGMSRLALGFAILFVLFALASPFWSFRIDDGGGNYVNTVYGWWSVTSEEFRNGGWDKTTQWSYASSDLNQPNLASAMGASYLLGVIYLIILVVVVVLFSLERTRTMAPLVLLVLSLIVVIGSLLALFYPILSVQSAVTADPDFAPLVISGFWGIRTDSAGTVISWGAGLGWWFLLVAVLLGIVGVALPYVRSVRAMGAPKPRPWAPRR